MLPGIIDFKQHHLLLHYLNFCLKEDNNYVIIGFEQKLFFTHLPAFIISEIFTINLGRLLNDTNFIFVTLLNSELQCSLKPFSLLF